MACSQEIYDYDFAHRQRILRKKQETPKDFDASAYVTRCVFARADDGEACRSRSCIVATSSATERRRC